MKKETFIKGVEKLIDPIEVSTIHFIQYFNKFVPKNIQRKMANSSGKTTPYMGFVVEPYSSFLFYEIKDIELAKSFLPNNFELEKIRIFEDDDPKYMCIFGCTNAHTSGFIGARVEFYIIAKNLDTNMTSWIIADYDTNTITYDPKDIFRDPNSKTSINTIDFDGHLYVDMINDDDRRLAFDFDISKGKFKKLDENLWINGNLSIGYGKNKSIKDPEIFSLIFDFHEFEQALDIDLASVNIVENNWFDGLFYDKPLKVACFPYAQHFLSDSPGSRSNIRSKDDLFNTFKNIDFDKTKPFSTENIKKLFLLNGVLLSISMLINIILLLIVFR